MEVCVESIEGARIARAARADRIELCSGLAVGGLTPSAGLLEAARDAFGGPVQVLIRPRPGDFLYSELELRLMEREIELARAAGAAGVVVGVLRADGAIDVERLRRLLDAAEGLELCFHRAFDLARDARASLDVLLELGVARLLSSGQAASALAGAPLLAQLVQQAGQDLCVMAGGGVGARNAAELLARSGVRELHLSGGRRVASAMEFRRGELALGHSGASEEYERRETDAQELRLVRDALDALC